MNTTVCLTSNENFLISHSPILRLSSTMIPKCTRLILTLAFGISLLAAAQMDNKVDIVTDSVVKSNRLLQPTTGCLLQNDAFEEFSFDETLSQDFPSDWQWAVGKSVAGQPLLPVFTNITQGPDGGIVLTNTPDTTHFLQIHQYLNITETGLYELNSFGLSADTNSLPWQDAYIKFATVDETTAPEFWDRQSVFQQFVMDTELGNTLTYARFSDVGRVRVSIFFNGVGSVRVNRICLRKPLNDIEALIYFVIRYYSYFGIRGPSLEEFQKQVALIPEQVESGSVAPFDSVLWVVSNLTQSDPHVYLNHVSLGNIPPRGYQPAPLSPLFDPQGSYVLSRVTDQQTFTSSNGEASAALLGKVPLSDNTTACYLALVTLVLTKEEEEAIRTALRDMLTSDDIDYVIIDLRYNPGGDESIGINILQDIQTRGQDTVSEFVPVNYATQSFRSSSVDETLFYSTPPRQTLRAPEAPEMAVLTSQNCISSCEGTVLAFRATGATLIGENTLGASGNPIFFEIPQLGRVYFSFWRAGDAVGNVFETIGIEPDIRVNEPVTAELDAVLEAAIDLLVSKQTLASSSPGPTGIITPSQATRSPDSTSSDQSTTSSQALRRNTRIILSYLFSLLLLVAGDILSSN